MSKWQSCLKADPTPWLLEPENPSVRYFTLTEILDRPVDNWDVVTTRHDIIEIGDVPKLLEGLSENGYWNPGNSFYLPRYTSTAWRFMLLAEYNVDGSLPWIRKIVDYLYQHAQVDTGGFAVQDITRREPNSDGSPCFTGNMIWSLIRLGYLSDPQVQNGIDWLVKYSRFDDGETTNWPEWLPQDPDDFCWGKHTCFRGVIAHLQALAEIPIENRSLQVKQTLEEGVEYLLIHHVYKHSHDLCKPIAKYVPIGFPLFGENDMLRMLLFLTKLGVHDDRMQDAVNRLARKQNQRGQWKQQHVYQKTKYTGFMPIPIDDKGQPSKWVTLRALTVLKRYYS
jgi:hypothetical protein